MIGASVNFDCCVSFIDGKNMTRYVLEETNLKLIEIEQKDLGSYVCEVSSVNGPTITAKARLTVTSKFHK